MSSVLADFTARFDAETDQFTTPTKGRIILGSDRLVFAASESEKLTIPLSSVIDIVIGSVPQVFDPLPGTPITIAVKRDGTHQTLLVAADETTINKFTTVLFKTILNGTDVTIKHPAKLGGRVLDTDFRGGILGIETGAVRIETDEGPIIIGLDAVIDFDRKTRAVGGRDQPVVVVDHMHTGEAMTTVVAMESSRLLAILGRFLRREYEKQIEALRDLSLSGGETEVLTTIYSTGDENISLAGVLGIEPDQVKRLLHALHRKDLIESGDNGPVLTSKGQVVVNQYLERVNE